MNQFDFKDCLVFWGISVVVFLIIALFLAGCAPENHTIKAQEAGSALVYRRITPVQSEASVKFKSGDGKVATTLADPTWVQNLNYSDIGSALTQTVLAFTDPGRLPLTVLFDKIDDLTDVFTQGRDVELKQLETMTQVEEVSVWKPDGASKVLVRDGALRVMVEGEENDLKGMAVKKDSSER